MTDDWQQQAACARPGISRDLRGAFTVPDPPVAAQLVCAQCPVRPECFTWAEEQPDYEGLAGGAVFTEKTVEVTEWTPASVRHAALTGKRKVTAPRDGKSRSYRPKGIVVEDVEFLAELGLAAPAIAAQLGVKAGSIYTRLLRTGRQDLWELIRQAGVTGVAAEKQSRKTAA